MATQGLPSPTGGTPSLMNDPDKCNEIAAAMASGWTNDQLAEHYKVSTRTISRWRRDPRIRAPLKKYTEDRILAITRSVDSKIESILRDSELSVQELLAIRKEFLGGAFREQAESSSEDPEVVSAAMQALEENPSFMEDIEKLFSKEPDVPSEAPGGAPAATDA